MRFAFFYTDETEVPFRRAIVKTQKETLLFEDFVMAFV